METKKINKYKANVISSLKIIVRFLREPLNSMFVTVLTFVFNTNLTFTFFFYNHWYKWLTQLINLYISRIHVKMLSW